MSLPMGLYAVLRSICPSVPYVPTSKTCILWYVRRLFVGPETVSNPSIVTGLTNDFTIRQTPNTNPHYMSTVKPA